MSYEILAIILPVVSAVLVAVFNNWEKINPAKRKINDILDITKETKETAEQNKKDIVKLDKEMRQNVGHLNRQVDKIREAQKTELQTQILNKCKAITARREKGHYVEHIQDYTEDLKQLIILYKEYYTNGFNHYGQIYFDKTLAEMEQIHPHIASDLMQTLFSDYVVGKGNEDKKQ